jgi:hypothetical protein
VTDGRAFDGRAPDGQELDGRAPDGDEDGTATRPLPVGRETVPVPSVPSGDGRPFAIRHDQPAATRPGTPPAPASAARGDRPADPATPPAGGPESPGDSDQPGDTERPANTEGPGDAGERFRRGDGRPAADRRDDQNGSGGRGAGRQSSDGRERATSQDGPADHERVGNHELTEGRRPVEERVSDGGQPDRDAEPAQDASADEDLPADEPYDRGRSVRLALVVASFLVAIFLALAELASAWILILLPAVVITMIAFHRVLLRMLARRPERGEDVPERRA